MHAHSLASRRNFLKIAGGFAVGLTLPTIPCTVLAAEKKQAEGKESEVNPIEDLMREHGVLRRVLLIYEEALVRLDGAREIPPGVIADSAGIIQRFVEHYHEKLEEEEIFPRFEEAGKFGNLVRVLYAQHQAGRRLTSLILKLSKPSTPATAEAGQNLAKAIRQFIRMYRPHAAREDTVLFPAFRSVVSSKEFDVLGEKFEDREQELFGKKGFVNMVNAVAEIEKKLGIYELAQFTPEL